MRALWGPRAWHAGRAIVARIALLAGAGQMMNRHGRRRDAVDRIALAKCEIEIAVTIDGDRARSIQRRTLHGGTIGSRLTFAGPSIGLDRAAGKIHLPNTVIPDIADEKPALGIHGNAVRLTKLRPCGRSAVPGESRGAGAGERGDHAGFRVDFPHDVVVAFGNVQVPGGVELDFVRHVQRCCGCRPAVAAVRLLAVARNRGRPMRAEIESADPLIVQITKIQRAIWPDHQTVRIVDFPIGDPGEPVPMSVDTDGPAAMARVELRTTNTALRASRRFIRGPPFLQAPEWKSISNGRHSSPQF